MQKSIEIEDRIESNRQPRKLNFEDREFWMTLLVIAVVSTLLYFRYLRKQARGNANS